MVKEMKRVKQITIYHCGPAVLEMLVSVYGIDIDQRRFVMAAGVDNKRLKTHGMLIGELGTAINRLLPNMRFWYKYNSNINDLVHLSRVRDIPVGIEWQGVFLEDADEDDGHYSIVTDVNLKGNLVQISDPYYMFAGKDRSFTIDYFLGRWWDSNDIEDPLTNSIRKVEDYQSCFVILPDGLNYPLELGMKIYE
jgi:hypothetical protein